LLTDVIGEILSWRRRSGKLPQQTQLQNPVIVLKDRYVFPVSDGVGFQLSRLVLADLVRQCAVLRHDALGKPCKF
jgi:hypothetical protein